MKNDNLNDYFFSNDYLNFLQSKAIQVGSRKYKVVVEEKIISTENEKIYLVLIKKNLELFRGRKNGYLLLKYPVSEFRDFILEWSKPWRSEYLRLLSEKEVDLIIKGNLVLQAETEQELNNRYSEVEAKLRLVDPPVDLTLLGERDEVGHFQSIEDIEAAVKTEDLVPINPDIVQIDPIIIEKFGNTVIPKLAFLCQQLLQQFKEKYPLLLAKIEFASGTRDLETQKLLGKLGYPAAKLSNHTRGMAVDFRLTKDAKTEWNQELSSTGGFQKIDTLLKNGIQPTINNLLSNGVISNDNFIAKLDGIFSSSSGLFRLDEAPFFRAFDQHTGETIGHQPLWHIQLNA